MKIKYIFLILQCFIVVFFVVGITDTAYAYDTYVAHPGFTEMAARLYNQHQKNGIALTEQHIKWLKEGSVEEDTPFRWLNHFYDPVHNKGFKGSFLSSKDWSRDMPKQARYSKGDQSWQRALFSYHKGMDHEAFVALGHVLHLIEDATVPAHTRDDAHYPDTDPYEDWTRDNFGKPTITPNILTLKTLDNYFDDVANFSNNNFYSEDTIEDRQFSKIQLISGQSTSNETYALNSLLHNKYKLYKFGCSPEIGWCTEGTKNTVNDPLVLSDYYSFLGTKAVSSAAGVIDLFFKTYETEPSPTVLLFQTHPLGVVQEAFVDAGYGTIDTWNQFKTAVLTIYNEVKNNIWQMTDMIEAFKVGINIFKVNDALAATFAYKYAAPAQQFASFPHDTNKETNGGGASTPLSAQDSARLTVAHTKIQPQSTASSASASAPRISSSHALPPQPPVLPPSPPISSQSTQTSAPVVAPTSASSPSSGGASSGGGSFRAPAAPTDHAASASPAAPTQSSSAADNSVSADNSAHDANTAPLSTTTPASTIPPPTINTPTSTVALTAADATSTVWWMADAAVTLDGTTTASTTAILINQSASDALLTTSTWSVLASLAEGINTFSVSAQNAEGATSTPASIIIGRDTTAPISTIITAASSSQGALFADLVWSAKDKGAGVAWYDVEIASSTSTASASSTASPVWQPLFTHTSSTTATVPLLDGATYYFRVRAGDALGNVSAWSASSHQFTPVLDHTVVINEIAWAGTSASANDQWMELMNTAGAPLDMNGFHLTDGHDIDIQFTTGTIPAYGYWLLERTTSTVIKRMGILGNQYGALLNGTADGGIQLMLSTGAHMRVGQVYSGALANGGDDLALYDARGVLADQVSAAAQGWFAGASAVSKTLAPPRTMQRIDPRASGNIASNWETNNGTLKNGSDAAANAVYGTPLQPNRGFTPLMGTLASSTTLTARASPYLLYGLTVPTGITLTIEPGVLIKAYNVQMTVDGGKVNSVGSADNPIIFTSLYDTTYGSVALEPAPTSFEADYWHRVSVKNGGAATFVNAVFAKGGYLSQKGTIDGVLHAENGATVAVDNSVIRDNARGIGCAGGGTAVTIQRSALTRNAQGGVHAEEGCVLSIMQSTIADNFANIGDTISSVGVEAIRAKVNLDTVTIENNHAAAVTLLNSYVTEKNVTFSGNSINAMVVRGEALPDQIWSADVPWYVDVDFEVPSGITLTVERDAVIGFDVYGGLKVEGALVARGTLAHKIHFTSSRDTAFLPALFPDSAPVASWKGITFASSTDASLLYRAEINHAGIILKQGKLTLEHSAISNTGTGVSIQGGEQTLDDVSFENLSVGIIQDASASTTFKRMSLDKFTNVATPTIPAGLF